MRNKKIASLLRALFLIVVSLVLGINLYSWNARSLTGNVLPMPFGFGGAVVMSGSMEPAIAVDELIIVKAENSYEVGDVVVYQTDRMLVVHRIVAIDGEMVTTRGDANNANDDAIELARIKGKVIAHVPHVGAAVRILKSPVAILLLTGAAVLTVELPFRREKEEKDDELERIKAEIRRLKEEQENG